MVFCGARAWLKCLVMVPYGIAFSIRASRVPCFNSLEYATIEIICISLPVFVTSTTTSQFDDHKTALKTPTLTFVQYGQAMVSSLVVFVQC